jgi:hypothetical protein
MPALSLPALRQAIATVAPSRLPEFSSVNLRDATAGHARDRSPARSGELGERRYWLRLAAPVMANRRLLPVTAAHDYDDLHHLVDRLSPRQAERLRVLVASDPELASAAQVEAEGAGEQAGRRLSVIGIWESGQGDLSERHDEIIRGRLKRPA